MATVADLFIQLSKNLQTPMASEQEVATNAEEKTELVAQLHQALWKRFKKPSKATLTRIRKLFFEGDGGSQCLWEFWSSVLGVDELWQFGPQDYSVGVSGESEPGIGMWAPLFRREVKNAQRIMAAEEDSSDHDGARLGLDNEHKESRLGSRYQRSATAPMKCPTWDGDKATCAQWVTDTIEFVQDMRVDPRSHFQVLLASITGEVARLDFRQARETSEDPGDYETWLKTLLATYDVGRLGFLLNKFAEIKQTGSFRQFKFKYDQIWRDLDRLGWPGLAPNLHVIWVVERCLKPDLAKVIRSEKELPVTLAAIQVLINERRLEDDEVAAALAFVGKERTAATGHCRDFALGKCVRKGNCRFRHADPCRLFAASGICRFGANCKFAHMARGQGARAKTGAGDGGTGETRGCFYCKSIFHMRDQCGDWKKKKEEEAAAASVVSGVGQGARADVDKYAAFDMATTGSYFL